MELRITYMHLYLIDMYMSVNNMVPFADVRLVKVFPSVGNVLGGTPVAVSGPCVQNVQDASDIAVTCTFDGVSVEGEYLMDQSQFLCITPQLQTIGRIPFTLEVTQPNTSDRYTGHATFYIGKSIIIT